MTEIISQPYLSHVPDMLSHLLQFEHSADVWADESLLAILQG